VLHFLRINYKPNVFNHNNIIIKLYCKSENGKENIGCKNISRRNLRMNKKYLDHNLHIINKIYLGCNLHNLYKTYTRVEKIKNETQFTAIRIGIYI